MVGHGALLMRTSWMQSAYTVHEGDCIPFKTQFIFGVSEWELFWTLTHSGTLAIVPHETVRRPEAMAWVTRNGATSLDDVVQFGFVDDFVRAVADKPVPERKLRAALLFGAKWKPPPPGADYEPSPYASPHASPYAPPPSGGRRRRNTGGQLSGLSHLL